MPDVLDVIVVFHSVDELFHLLSLVFVVQLLIVLGNHFNLCGNEGGENREIPNYLGRFDFERKTEYFKQFCTILRTYVIIQGQHIA